MSPGPRRDGTVAFLTGAFFELLIWSLEARPPTTAGQADAIFRELAAPVLAAAAPAQSASGRTGRRSS